MNYKLLLSMLILPVSLNAQVAKKQPAANNYKSRTLFTAGLAGGLIGGLYDGIYPVSTLKANGDFGLGAPDKIDGELVMFKGKVYQTQASGKTFEVTNDPLVPFAMVNYFHADRSVQILGSMDKPAFFHCLDSLLTNPNGLYAIHIKGRFAKVRTRAFPPSEPPYPPLSNILGKQHFFEYTTTSGDLIGYRLPAFMDNTNISGYHFHYLSDNKQQGGHMVDLHTDDITIEISILDSYTVLVPTKNAAFDHFDFRKDRGEDIKSVERGAKK